MELRIGRGRPKGKGALRAPGPGAAAGVSHPRTPVGYFRE